MRPVLGVHAVLLVAIGVLAALALPRPAVPVAAGVVVVALASPWIARPPGQVLACGLGATLLAAVGVVAAMLRAMGPECAGPDNPCEGGTMALFAWIVLVAPGALGVVILGGGLGAWVRRERGASSPGAGERA